MTAIERRRAAATERGKRILAEIGRELRAARRGRSLSQAVVATAAGLTQSQVSLIERGRYPAVTFDALVRLAAVLGLDLSARLFPAGEPIRDAAHARLLERFRELVGELWTWAAEVPLPIPCAEGHGIGSCEERAWSSASRRRHGRPTCRSCSGASRSRSGTGRSTA